MKKKSKSLATKTDATEMTSSENRAWLRNLQTNLEPDLILKKAVRASKHLQSPDEATKEEMTAISEAMMVLGHERHYLVAESVADEGWRPMIIDLAIQIQKEYVCSTSSEIALAGMAAAAYYRYLRAARKINGLLGMEAMGTVAMQLTAHVSKEADRAYRQYLSSIEALRSRRQPPVNVKLQAKAAFIGENQTFNTKPA